MMFSFARLFRENDGATKDLVWWCFRLAVVFTLFGTGRAVINTWGEIGYDIVNVTEFRKTLWDAEIEFNTNYEKFTEGLFLVKATSATDAIAALTTDDVNLRNITDAAANPSAWSLPNIFIYGSALQRQASETRIEGQAQAEIARATAMKEASDRQARAHQILGLHSASASRDQSLGAVAGGYALALRMNEAQRQATTGLIERSRDQQVIGILADRSLGQRQAGIQAGREERD